MNRYRHRAALLIALALLMVGCQGQTPASDAPPEPNLNEVKLTTEIWLQSTDEQKFSPETLARLRREDPELKSSARWKEFYNGQVKPAFQQAHGLNETD